MKKLSLPGLYLDAKNAMHFFPEQYLRAMNIADTQANRDQAAAWLQKFVQQHAAKRGVAVEFRDAFDVLPPGQNN